MNKRTPSGHSFLNTEDILKKAGVAAGQRVVDLGCGGGYFVLQAARLVGDEGLVYGVDILKHALSSVASKARMYSLSNVRLVWSNVENYGGAREIKNNSIDVALLVQLLSQSKKHAAIFKETARMVKPYGLAVVIDWQRKRPGFGPSAEHYISPEEARRQAVDGGFVFVKEIEAGPYHYGLIFQKK